MAAMTHTACCTELYRLACHLTHGRIGPSDVVTTAHRLLRELREESTVAMPLLELSTSTSDDAGEILSKALASCGREYPNRLDAARQVGRDLAGDFIAQRITSRECASRIADLVKFSELHGQCDLLEEFVSLDGWSCHIPGPEFDREIRAAAERLTAG